MWIGMGTPIAASASAGTSMKDSNIRERMDRVLYAVRDGLRPHIEREMGAALAQPGEQRRKTACAPAGNLTRPPCSGLSSTTGNQSLGAPSMAVYEVSCSSCATCE